MPALSTLRNMIARSTARALRSRGADVLTWLRLKRRGRGVGKLDDLDLAVQQIELEPEVPCFLPAGVPHDALTV
jgi:hypothetical protein